MRVRLIFNLINRGAELPFHHQFIIADFFKEYVMEYFKIFKETNNVFYNFSALKGQTRVSKDGLQFHSKKVSLIFSSNEPELVRFLILNIYKKTKVILGNLILNPENVDLENQIEFKNETKYICLSPLSIFNPVDNPLNASRFISPVIDFFSDTLYENTMDRMERAGLCLEEIAQYFEFQIIPDQEYLDKMKSEQKKIARIFPVFIGEQKREVRGYIFPFTLYADPKVHEFIFTYGFGELTQIGFGMLDIANADPSLRSIPYSIEKNNGDT